MSAETKTVEKRKRLLKREMDGPSSNQPQKIAKLLAFPDRGELELSQPPSTSRRHANTVSVKPDLQQSFHFPKTSSISESRCRFLDSSKRFKRVVSRCYSSTTNAKNSCTNPTAKVFTKSKSNKLPYLPETSPKFVCHCNT